MNSGCAAVSGANVEIWHVDAAGNYSQYGSQTTQTYLRGIQTTNSNGEVTFTTIYPGWYQGRATHIHLEVTIERPIGQGDADRVSRGDQQHRPRKRRLRVARLEPDVERVGRDLRRQPVVGADHADGERRERLRRDVPGGDCGLVTVRSRDGSGELDSSATRDRSGLWPDRPIRDPGLSSCDPLDPRPRPGNQGLRLSSRFCVRSASVIVSSTPLAGTSTFASQSSAFSMMRAGSSPQLACV